MKLFVPQDSLFSKYPLFQLVEYFAEYCSIKNPQHIQLLYNCLSASTSKDVLSTFNKLGLHVDIPSQGVSSLYQVAALLTTTRANPSEIQTYLATVLELCTGITLGTR